jgi:hypothetical protein
MSDAKHSRCACHTAICGFQSSLNELRFVLQHFSFQGTALPGFAGRLGCNIQNGIRAAFSLEMFSVRKRNVSLLRALGCEYFARTLS